MQVETTTADRKRRVPFGLRRYVAVPVALLLGLVLGYAVNDARQRVPSERGRSFLSGDPRDYELVGTSCGSAEVGLGAALAPSSIECLLGAFESGALRYLIERRHTVEGDPVWTVFKVVAPGTVDVIHDARDDKFGSGLLERRRCRALSEGTGNLRGQLQLGACEDVG